jgi:hypothetical protein
LSTGEASGFRSSVLAITILSFRQATWIGSGTPQLAVFLVMGKEPAEGADAGGFFWARVLRLANPVHGVTIQATLPPGPAT